MSLVLLCVAMASCTGLGPTVKPTPAPAARSACDGWKPIYPTVREWRTLSQKTVDEIDADDEQGAKIGCWKPNGQ